MATRQGYKLIANCNTYFLIDFSVPIINPDSPKDISLSEASFISVSHRLMKPEPHRRPTFRSAITKSLLEIVPGYTKIPMELSVSQLRI